MDPPPPHPLMETRRLSVAPDSPKQTAAAPLGSSAVVNCRGRVHSFHGGWQLGVQMWGSPESGDSVTPKWPVCFPRRGGKVRGYLRLKNLDGATSYSTPAPSSAPSTLLRCG